MNLGHNLTEQGSIIKYITEHTDRLLIFVNQYLDCVERFFITILVDDETYEDQLVTKEELNLIKASKYYHVVML